MFVHVSALSDKPILHHSLAVMLHHRDPINKIRRIFYVISSNFSVCCQPNYWRFWLTVCAINSIEGVQFYTGNLCDFVLDIHEATKSNTLWLPTWHDIWKHRNKSSDKCGIPTFGNICGRSLYRHSNETPISHFYKKENSSRQLVNLLTNSICCFVLKFMVSTNWTLSVSFKPWRTNIMFVSNYV